ncbi:MAG: hypothetical protein QM756_01875 [Polyangiaceae bacterium]
MHPYISDTELAARGLFELIGQDDLILERKGSELRAAVGERQRAQAILHAGAPPSAFGEDTTAYFEKKIRDARELSARVESEIADLEPLIAAKEASIQALAGAVLQIAKQGIAIAYRSLASCPPGRSIGRETVSNTIWQARNQSMHWEESTFKPQVLACFNRLALDFGPEFQLPPATPRSLARQVVRLLGWSTYGAYEQDMVSLLP